MRRGGFALRAAAAVRPGEVLGIIGANGSGKSTLLGAISGTHRIEAGRVVLDGRPLVSRATGVRGVEVARSGRRIALLDQRSRLFPHLGARANIAFGPRAQGVPRREADAVAEEWLGRIGLAGRGGAREPQLSGGQQQRVAIARALAAGPRALLLDEPFAALDVTSRAELRSLVAQELRRLGIPGVIVTHDPTDLLALADRVLVLEAGEAAQLGTVAEVLDAPATPFAAELTGRVLLAGTATGAGTLRPAAAPLDELRGVGELPAPGEPAVASYPPGELRIAPLAPQSGAIPGSVPAPGSIPAPIPAPALAAAANTDAASGEPRTNAWTGTIGAVSAEAAGLRVDCAEWPGAWARLPLSGAPPAWIAPGTRVRFALDPAVVRFAAPGG